jgi:hypothetical protein
LPPGITFENGQDLTSITFAVAVNHALDKTKDFAEELVVFAQFLQGSGPGARKVMREMGTVSMTDFVDKDGYAYFECMLYWPTGQDPRKIQLFYRSLDPRDTSVPVPVTPALSLDFWTVSWNPDHPSVEQIQKDNKAGNYSVDHAISAPGRWHLAHRFAEFDDIAVIYLWRFATPTHFEMHSHVESNHCSPLPPAWVHIWDNAIEWHAFQPGYWWQDKLAPLALGEGGEIGSGPTATIANTFLNDLPNGSFHKVFPFLSPNADHVGCLMPMDMEYMHFNGYFGIPISQVFPSRVSESGEIESTRWYCWDAIWKFETNNRPVATDDGYEFPARYSNAPRSKNGEVWCWMEAQDAKSYEPWKTQRNAHSSTFSNSRKSSRARNLPFFHFDPRRYTAQSAPLEETGWSLADVLSQPIQSSTCSGTPNYFGFKLYTAMGWAPGDPFLRQLQEEFYSFCESNHIPLLNHGTPAGYYTHDRRHYFDLLLREGKIVDGSDDRMEAGWISQFARTIPGPDRQPMTPRSTKDEHWWSHHEEDRVWWFIHHYVSAQAWRKVLARFPNLKICLAHFGDSDHLSSESWSTRKDREPHRKAQKLTLAFDGDRIDPARTHRFLYDLLDLIQPENRVFADLSYVILTEHNAAKFTELFQWAREHKPILLERILWGTDWPLIAKQKPVTDAKGGNMLHRYAKGFQAAIPKIPSDFFFRACFLNPLQYLDLGGVHQKLKITGSSSPWEWVEDLDKSLFDMNFQGDKAELLYRSTKSLAKGLET